MFAWQWARWIDAAGPDINRVSFSVPDVEYGTPDANLATVVDVLLRHNG